ncbi:MAG: hypothetical protein H6710_03855 [Myxococcales bacterium]|nr:hypothetical protein [Myxococcales bacterium]MCB9705798.1 hypothetical protein [Myxococcales bacterium]
MSSSGCGEHKSLEDSLKTNAEDEFEKSGAYKPNPKKRPPDGLPPPTDAELKAWDRKDPEGEKHLYKFDKQNLKKMLNYWNELECYRENMKQEGEKAFGIEPGSPEDEQWYQFKQVFIPKINAWQQRLFANEPRILEKSKLIGHFLEAHELIMHGYPKAYNDSDRTEIEKSDAHWIIIENKITKYLKNIGGELPPKPNLEDPKQKEAHDKFCEKALNPPKNTGKAKVKKVSGGGKKAKKLDMSN